VGRLTALIDTSVLVSGVAPEIDEQWAVSVVSIGELEAGVLSAGDEVMRAQRLRLLAAILVEAPVVPVDGAVAARYGELRVVTGRRPTNDLWIAATALAHEFTLVTADRAQAALPLVAAQLVGRGSRGSTRQQSESD
jgi:predicted nucleic acid-binding protein